MAHKTPSDSFKIARKDVLSEFGLVVVEVK
jgi:hypothetical protein